MMTPAWPMHASAGTTRGETHARVMIFAKGIRDALGAQNPNSSSGSPILFRNAQNHPDHQINADHALLTDSHRLIADPLRAAVQPQAQPNVSHVESQGTSKPSAGAAPAAQAVKFLLGMPNHHGPVSHAAILFHPKERGTISPQ